MSRQVWLLFVVLGGLAGCADKTPLLSLKPPERKIPADDYEEYLHRWWRHDKIIKQLDTTLRVNAVFLSPQFAAAYTSKRAEVFKLPPRRVKEVVAELRERWEESYPFIIGAAAMDYTWNDFDRTDSVWRISLENDQGDEVEPVILNSMGDIDATIQEFYPFVDRFHRVYDVRFPKESADGQPLVNAETKKLYLQFAGPLGHSKLEWRIR
jgi:hypothetical protein